MPDLKKLNVGGQAVLEGVMMRSRRFWAVAVRKPDDTIGCGVFKEISITNRKKVLGWPFIRGIVALVENLSLGFRALSYSVNESTGEDSQDFKKPDEHICCHSSPVYSRGFFRSPYCYWPDFQQFYT